MFSLRKRKTNQTKLIAYLIISIGLIFYQQFYASFANKITFSIYSSVSSITNITRQPSIFIENSLKNLSYYFNAMDENKELVAENRKLKAVYKKALVLLAENQDLRYIANMSEYLEYETVAADVYFDSSNLYANSIMVKIGKNKGVKEGYAALTAEGLIGRVLEVGEDYSRILLMDDYNASIPVRVLETGVQGIIKGQNNPNYVNLITKEIGDHISVGQHVVSSSVQGLFDDGIPVGIISHIDGNTVKISPYANLNRLHKVLIIKRRGV